MDRQKFNDIFNTELTLQQKKVLTLFIEKGLSDQEICEILAQPNEPSPEHRTEKVGTSKVPSLHRTVPIQNFRSICKKFNIIPEKSEESDDRDDYRELLVNLFMNCRPELVCQKIREKYKIMYCPRYPEGAEPLNSEFYIERKEFDTECYNTLVRPGSLIRIRAPRQMGKTSLIKRIKSKATHEGTQCVYLDFSLFGISEETDLSSFLKQLYKYFLQTLPNVEPDTNRHENISTLVDFSFLFQSILKQVNSDIILFFDEVDALFKYPNISVDFFAMLRNWHSEKATDSELSNFWGKLKLVLAFSTEDYGKLNINQSPFNVGKLFQLVDLTPNQVTTLIRRHYVESKFDSQIEDLKNLVGGHPYLLRLGLYYIAEGKLKKDQLISEMTINDGIYKPHLEMLLDILMNNPNLGSIYKEILGGKVTDTKIDPFELKKLEHMGLIKTRNNIVLPRRELYKYYFSDRIHIK
jgi:AAA-like domain